MRSARIAEGARAISPEAKAAPTYICLTIYGFGIFAMFYGTAAVVRGYLVLRSGYRRGGSSDRPMTSDRAEVREPRSESMAQVLCCKPPP
jgi:hypothetical protein